ncbi:MAG: glutamine--fructose-6-phosphate transaminase (isomerizing) [Proteobacteria bacterium]|nr:MAG: glutamine--fructose-6-phosphate transaminase (isomerizing) [Pseudomonadota bacterium]
MCGIVGYIGHRPCINIIFDGLKKLEYRGYDSAGIAVLHKGEIALSKEAGKIDNLKTSISKLPQDALVGIGHTRWATHGLPTKENAHPHQAEKLALIHNGIIENYKELKQELLNKGIHFRSETDTEVVAHLVAEQLKTIPIPIDALKKVIERLEGAFSLAFVVDSIPDQIFVAKQGSPLVVGLGDKEVFFGSDITAFVNFTQKAVFLHDGDIAQVSASGIKLWDKTGSEVQPKITHVQWSPGSADKQGFRHYMLKEIHEQPRVVSATTQAFVNGNSLNLEALGLEKIDLKKLKSLHIVACGTAYYAGMASKYFLEPLLGISVNVELASEFRYRNPYLMPNGETMVMAISQSGETADTLASIKHAKERGCQIFSICNVAYSSIHRESDSALLMHAGPEIGVASTKAFTSQVLCAYLWALGAAVKLDKISADELASIIQDLKTLPLYLDQALNTEGQIADLAAKLYQYPNFLFIGRGMSNIIALEGALKLKEISYIHAEGYAAGELKHGPIALVDKQIPIVAILPHDHYYEKTLSNVEEVCAREGQVYGIGDERDARLKEICVQVIPCPQVKNPVFQAILSTVAVQFLSYHIAVKRGTDVDQPRNLAKSVTVE